MSCYYCLQNIRDEKCEFEIEGYPLPVDIECRHFEFDTGIRSSASTGINSDKK